MKRLPLGIKILVFVFFLEALGYLSSLSVAIRLGFFVLTLRIIILVLFLCTIIGLLKLKKWGRKSSVVCLVLMGISYSESFVNSFIPSFIEGFERTSGKYLRNSPSLNILAIIFAVLTVGIPIYFLIKYLYQGKMKNVFI